LADQLVPDHHRERAALSLVEQEMVVA
jgi:hypothetical protein